MPDYPLISILIAARNEAGNIQKCLEAISMLDYPNFEVWVGNDQSEDNTAQIIQDFIAQRSNFHLLNIVSQIGRAKGKANVLAQLAHKAQGGLFLITDADVEVPNTWAKAILAQYKPEIGIITGCTIPVGASIFAQMQAIDWVQALSLLKLTSDLGLPLTAMGNNLLVSREAYFSVGGYESIPFSITEDYELFNHLKQKNWQSEQVFNTEVLASTQAAQTWQALLQQRKRWMHGAMEVPWFIKIALVAQALFLPAIILLCLFLPIWGLSIWVTKFIFQCIWTSIQVKKLNKIHLIKLLPIHEFYSTFLMLAMGFFYLLPIPVVWKGRKY